MKRFWKTACISEVAFGHAVHLDDRAVRTPAKQPFVMPSRALAEAIAAEWDGQGDAVVPASMPLTRAANTAIDRVAVQRTEVIATVAAYGETDLVCYRAPHPRGLAARQAEVWDPLLSWAEEVLAAPLRVAEGVMFVGQDSAALEALRRAVQAHDDWELTALHDLVALSGSLVIGLALSAGRLDPASAWPLSRIDEDWNIAEWGEDDEARAAAEGKRAEFEAAARFLDLVRARSETGAR